MKPLIQSILRSRGNYLELCIVALCVGLGVNLFATWTDGYLKSNSPILWPWLTGSRLELLLALILVSVGVLFFVRMILKERVMSKVIEGIILFDKKESKVIRVANYKFSELLADTMRAAFVENQALKTAFEAEPLFKRFEKQKVEKKANTELPEAAKPKPVSYAAIYKCDFKPEDSAVSEKSILIEGIEFCVLELLSMHLSNHFDNMDGCMKEIVTLKREDMPQLLLQNRILSLLSTPIEDRQIFVESGINKNEPPAEGELHMISTSEGAQYRRFDLTLPKRTKITRPQPGRIILKHKRFELAISVGFQGFTYNLPPYFKGLYVGHDDERIDGRKVHVEITGKLKCRSILAFNGWRYYEWIDSFFNSFEERVSFDAFLQKIDWASVSTRIRSSLILERRRAEQKEKKAQVQRHSDEQHEETPTQN